MTPYVSWDESERVYALTEESRRFAACRRLSGARDVSLMPYQEEPRDVPVRFVSKRRRGKPPTQFIPIVIAGSVEGADRPRRPTNVLLGIAQPLRTNVAHYRGARRADDDSVSTRRTSGSTRRSRGPRSASTRGSRPIRCSAPGSSRASAPQARASGRDSPGSSGATRSGRRSRSTRSATSRPPARRSSSCRSFSETMARSRTRSRRARR